MITFLPDNFDSLARFVLRNYRKLSIVIVNIFRKA